MHATLNDATRVLKEVVQLELDRRFGEIVSQAEAEIEDRIAIRHRSLIRHFENKIATLSEHKTKLSERGKSCRGHWRHPKSHQPEESDCSSAGEN